MSDPRDSGWWHSSHDQTVFWRKCNKIILKPRGFTLKMLSSYLLRDLSWPLFFWVANHGSGDSWYFWSFARKSLLWRKMWCIGITFGFACYILHLTLGGRFLGILENALAFVFCIYWWMGVLKWITFYHNVWTAIEV